MDKLINFINPSDKIINRINIHCLTSKFSYTYLISEKPHISADLILLSTNFLSCNREYKEFEYIPFIAYGNVNYIEQSFIFGAVDFLKDPWDFNELETRAIRFIKKDYLNFFWGKIYFSNEFIWTKEKSISFSVYEYIILSLLAGNLNKTVSRENMHYRLGIKNTESRVIDVYINSIRNKISILSEDKNSNIEIIRTIRGKGYTINSHYGCV